MSVDLVVRDLRGSPENAFDCDLIAVSKEVREMMDPPAPAAVQPPHRMEVIIPSSPMR